MAQAQVDHLRSAKRSVGQRVFRDPRMPSIPLDVTRRLYNPRHRAPGDQGVVRQTQLLTRRRPSRPFSHEVSTAQDMHPFWTRDEKFIFFSSNRVGPGASTTEEQSTAPRADAVFNIFRILPDGSGVTRITDGDDNKIEPAVSGDGGLLAYASGGTLTFDASQALVQTTGFNLFFVNLTTGNTPTNLTGINPSGFVFSDVRHPTWSPGGNTIAFSGQRGIGQPYHIYIVSTDTGRITQLSDGPSNDRAPAWSPDGNLIAFDTDAAGFSDTGPIVATGLNNFRNIWVMSPTVFRPNPKKVTGINGRTSSNYNPAWSTLRVDPLNIVPGETDINGNAAGSRQLLAFASNRDDGDGFLPTSTIYWMSASIKPDPAAQGSFTVTTPESVGNPALKLQLSTPDAAIDVGEPSQSFDPNNQWNEDYPTWPQYISSYRIVFQSNRGSNLNLWGATIFDINSPTLLKYNIPANEVINVSRNSSPGASTRFIDAGDTARFRVRAADYESGVDAVYLRIKCPNSQPKSKDNQEHKIFVVGPGVLDTNVSVINAPYEFDYQAIHPNLYTFRPPGSNNAGIPADWPAFNLYTPGTEDQVAFSASFFPEDEFWLPLHDDGPVSAGGNEPDGEKAGDGIYTAIWRTPVEFPSDWYLDVVVRDNAVDPFDPTRTGNWKIYDHVWGFTTEPFVVRSNFLFVNDYGCGQRFFQSRFGGGTDFFSYAGQPTESWMTEYDPALTPTLAFTGGAAPVPLVNVQTPLGVNSYRDGLTDDGTNIPHTASYDQWRILARGPIDDSILNQYGGRIDRQPADVIGGGVGERNVFVAEKCVIWHAPYTGNLFVGNGTLLDSDTQIRLTNFVRNGGRLFVNGQDIAWALTLGGQGGNTFLSTVLRSNFVADTAGDSIINGVRGEGIHPISTQYWLLPILHSWPNTIPYDPPAQGAMYLSTPNSGTPPRSYMCLNPVSPDVISFIPTPQDYVAGIDLTYQTPQNAPGLVWAVDATTNGRVVFSSFGFEAMNPESYAAGTARALKNRRVQLIHNIGDFLRTGRVIGFVRGVSTSQPIANAFIRAIDPRNGQTAATARTQGDGSYILSGLDALGIYAIDAASPGFVTAHLQASAFHGSYQGRLDLFLTEAQPGTISGDVRRATDNAPVAGAQVTAFDPIDPTDPTRQYSATTDVNGHYIIRNVPASDTAGYIVRITNITDLGYAGSTPPSYGGPEMGAQPAVTVNSSQQVTGIDFTLNPKPGRMLGKVTARDANGNDTGVGIRGAVVTATMGMTTLTATTDDQGNYTIANAGPGTYGVVAVAPGFAASASLTVVVVSDQDTINVNFALSPIPPGVISGLVATSNGQPVSGATVRVKDAAGNEIVPAVQTGALQTSGTYQFNYRITNVPAGTTVFVTAEKNGYNGNQPTNAIQVAVTSAPPDTQGVNLTLDPLHTFQRTLSLVSAPYDYTTPVTTLLNIDPADVTSGRFTFVTWTGTNYAKADTFKLGVGYFLENRNPAATLALTSTEQTTPTPDPFPIQLKAGWNMIGTPFPFPINFLALKIQDPTTGALTDVITAQSGPNPAIGAALWTFELGVYQLAYTLDPWRGYWIRAFRPVTLLVSSQARQDRSAKVGPRAVSRALEYGNSTGAGWKLDLHATAGEIRSAPATIGINRSASDDYDRFKFEAPPPVGATGVTFTVEHKEWGDKSGLYSVDVRSANVANQSWDFTITSNVLNTPVTLAWPSVATVPGKYDLFLTNLETNARTNLRNHRSIVLPASPTPITRRFRLTTRRATRQMLQLTNVIARINNTRAGGAPASVNIGYTLTADATVQVVVMQNGRAIRTVEPGRTRAAGDAEVTWDMRSDAGAIVSSNAYTVEVRATDEEGRVVRRIAPILITR